MKAIFRWDGNIIGFLNNTNLFDTDGTYMGWIEDNEIYDKNGIYKGEIYNNDYAIRNNHKSYMNKIPKIPPFDIIAPIPPLNRIGSIEMLGYSEIQW
ncbi:4-fold beta flower protein [Aliarcobacter butzleri]|uniref:4-fold beta flower protein n=1 Tax=Aliarcobacter butzleri TaxID=28197 RepID=UPI003AFA97F2